MIKEQVESQLVDWAEKDRAEPVWRDGRCSSNTYVVLATKKRDGLHNMVCLRKLSTGRFKLKFYPDEKEWGVTEDTFGLYPGEFYNRDEYRGTHVSGEKLRTVLAALKALRKGRVIKPEVLFYAFDTQYGLDKAVPPPPVTERQTDVPGEEDFKKTVRATFKKAAEKLDAVIKKRVTVKPVPPPDIAE